MPNIAILKENIKFTKQQVKELLKQRTDLEIELKAMLSYLEAILKFAQSQESNIQKLLKTVPKATDKITNETRRIKTNGLDSVSKKIMEHWNSEVDQMCLRLNRWAHEKTS
jgi:uncharacterized protein YgbK (DUF1537 family)